MDQIQPRKIFMFKTRKSEYHYWISQFQISLGTKFQLKLIILIFFLPDLPKNGFSGLKQKKWRPHIFYIILHIQISLVQNLISNWQFWFFGSNLPKMVFPVENKISEHQHRILHIWISLGKKFQLKLITISFWTKFIPKRSKEQTVKGLQAFAFCVVNFNSSVVFKHSQGLTDLIILKNF